MRLIIVSLLLTLFISPFAYAESPPIPARKSDLATIQKDLKSHKRRQNSLESQLKAMRKDLEKTRSEMAQIANEIRENEDNLEFLQKRIDKLASEEEELRNRLKQDYGSIAELIVALERMRRIPPESLIVRPGAPLKTAQSAMLLQSTLPAVHERAELLSKDLTLLNELTLNLSKDRNEALKLKEDLKVKHQKISKLSVKRETLYSNTEKDYAKAKKDVARLSKESKTLMELIDKIDQANNKNYASRAHITMPSSGRAQLPVSGYIIQAYGKPNAIGAVSRGISIESRPGSLVIAPMGGIVRFSGVFKNYGNMVIIEHSNEYHSLIAGLERIDIQLNGRIKAGEPIGQLPLTSSRGGRPALYYELRYKGQPINPAKRFTDIKS